MQYTKNEIHKIQERSIYLIKVLHPNDANMLKKLLIEMTNSYFKNKEKIDKIKKKVGLHV